MQEQSAKLSGEVRQNFKISFRTFTETSDTSSRRYVLANNTTSILICELSRKMRKSRSSSSRSRETSIVAIIRRQLGWSIGNRKFVHATGEAVDPNLKPSYLKPYASNIQNNLPAFSPNQEGFLVEHEE